MRVVCVCVRTTAKLPSVEPQLGFTNREPAGAEVGGSKVTLQVLSKWPTLQLAAGFATATAMLSLKQLHRTDNV